MHGCRHRFGAQYAKHVKLSSLKGTASLAWEMVTKADRLISLDSGLSIGQQRKSVIFLLPGRSILYGIKQYCHKISISLKYLS